MQYTIFSAFFENQELQENHLLVSKFCQILQNVCKNFVELLNFLICNFLQNVNNFKFFKMQKFQEFLQKFGDVFRICKILY